MEPRDVTTLKRKQTTDLLLSWEKNLLTTDDVTQKLSELGWTPGQVEKLKQGSYLLLPVV